MERQIRLLLVVSAAFFTVMASLYAPNAALYRPTMLGGDSLFQGVYGTVMACALWSLVWGVKRRMLLLKVALAAAVGAGAFWYVFTEPFVQAILTR